MITRRKIPALEDFVLYFFALENPQIQTMQRHMGKTAYMPGSSMQNATTASAE